MDANFEDWFQPIRPADSEKVLLCFPYSGSNATIFGGWRKELSADIQSFAAKLPGRHPRQDERPAIDLKLLADHFAEVISHRFGNDREIYLLGCSVGATLAFEVARSLRSRGVPTAGLFAAAARSPNRKWYLPKLHKLSDRWFLGILDHVFGAVPQAVLANKELRKVQLPILRADIQMYITYEYESQPPLACQIVTLSGKKDRFVKRKHIYPWGELATSFRHREFPDGHFFVRTHSRAVIEMIERRMLL